MAESNNTGKSCGNQRKKPDFDKEAIMKNHILCIGDSNTHGYCADPKD